MSNRTLIELNHDFSGVVDRHQRQFLDALQMFLSSASEENAERLKPFGVRVFGTRHHSEGFTIAWGCHKAAEAATDVQVKKPCDLLKRGDRRRSD